MAADERGPGEAFCKSCPDHEACMTGWPCDDVKRVNGVMELEQVVILNDRVIPKASLKAWPKNEGKTCWLRLRRHKWGDKKEFFTGKHYFKICQTCKRKRLTYHSGCSVACWGGLG